MPKKQQPKLWFSLPLILLMIFVLAGAGFLSLSGPADKTMVETQRFVIPKGQAVSIIADRLEEAGLVRNSLVFRLIVKSEGVGSSIQAGSFDLSPSMSAKEIAQQLTQGTHDLWVTIPEGWRREEIAQSIADQQLEVFDEDEFLTLTRGKEGRLFPDTYLVPRQISTAQVVEMLEQTFERKVIEGLEAEITASTHDFDEALIMASIVERESRGYEEMRMVAGVLWNRVEIGMALNADATLQYIKGYSSVEDSWWVVPTAADKQLTSAYNTYRYAGLPPTPIANPGVNAIKAALNPASTDYFYYLHDRAGNIHFARTLEEHNANVVEYLR